MVLTGWTLWREASWRAGEDRAQLRTMRRERKGAATAREASIAMTADAVRDGRGEARAWREAKARSGAKGRRDEARRRESPMRGAGADVG